MNESAHSQEVMVILGNEPQVTVQISNGKATSPVNNFLLLQLKN